MSTCDSLEGHFGNDVDSGAFEIDDDTLAASDRLLERYPEAQTWFLRIGYRGVHPLG